jgi:hypothetical protein
VGELVDGLHKLEEQVERFLHPSESDNAASVEPIAGNVSAAAVAANSAPEASTTAPVVASNGAETVSASPSANPSPSVAAGPGEDPNGVASAAGASSPVAAGSVTLASAHATSSPSDASSPAEPLTFEQRVEERFLKLEHAIVQLPHAIHEALSEGSHESPEAFASSVLKKLFAKL